MEIAGRLDVMLAAFQEGPEAAPSGLTSFPGRKALVMVSPAGITRLMTLNSANSLIMLSQVAGFIHISPLALVSSLVKSGVCTLKRQVSLAASSIWSGYAAVILTASCWLS